MIIDWNFVLAVITAFVAVLVLIQSQYQIRISNKQHLFDKRIENYLVIAGLIELYKNNRSYFEEKKEKVLLTNALSFTWLTNNSYLEKITPAIKNPLEESYHKALLLKLEDIKTVGITSSFYTKEKQDNYLEILFCLIKNCYLECINMKYF